MLIRPGFPPGYVSLMSDVAAPSPPTPSPPKTGARGLKKHVNTAATSRSLRHLAREAAEQGERLVEIARRLKIAPSTLHHWAREDGFRRKDVRARASLAHGPRLTGQADYPELKDLSPRARLARLGELAGMARLRAIAAVEEGYVDYGLKWLREAQKLARAGQALKEHLQHYPPPEEEVEDTLVNRAFEALDEMVLAEKEGRAPVYRELTPALQAEREENNRIWDAIEDARLERMTDERDGRAPEAEEFGPDRLLNFDEDVCEYWRLKGEAKKWRLFPGRGDPPPLRAVSRGRSILPQPEPDIPGGKKLYGIEEAFPVRFNR